MSLACYKDYSIEVLPSCVPDTGPLPPVAQPAFISDTLSVVDWNAVKTLIVAPGADPNPPLPNPGHQTEWDGTLPVRDLTTVPSWVFYLPTGSVPPIYVSRAINGYLGDNAGISLIQGGGAGPWTLDLNGFVGGVPTTLWHGEKAVGSCGAGTYMRTSGLSAGPQCLVLQGCAQALAWWAMEANPTAVVDVVNGLVLTASIPGQATLIPGKFLLALDLHCFGFTNNVSEYDGINIVFASGITIVAWVRTTYNISSVGSNRDDIFYLFWIGAVPHIISASHREGDLNWSCTFDGGSLISKPFAAGWHFLAITYDIASGTLGFDIDQSGMTTSLPGSFTPDLNPLTRFSIGASTALTGIGDMNVAYDEVALYDAVLTTEQLNWIYNTGTGRTYPV